MNARTIFSWILRLIAAYILLQTLRFKFIGLPESIYIFTKVGMEPWGRLVSGIVELIGAILLLIPRTTAWGALLALGTISGAIYFHLTTLGIEVQGDGGQLFYMAVAEWVASAILMVMYRKQIVSLLLLKLRGLKQ